jgi:hypothetical protein
VLIAASAAAAKLLEVGELVARVDALEAVLRDRPTTTVDEAPWSSNAA